MTISTADWEKKWRLMIDKDNNRKIQNEILGENLRDKKELEESTECTFQPNLTKTYQPGHRGRRSKDALLQMLLPIVSEEESILMELRRIEREEENSRRELRDVVASSLGRFPGKGADRLLDFYREERLKEICDAKNLKLEVVGRLQELERRFNILCTRESIGAAELRRVGFDIENCKNIRKELLRSLDNHESLKNRCRVSREFEEIVRSVAGERRSKSYDVAEDGNHRGSHSHSHSGNGTGNHLGRNANNLSYRALDNETRPDNYYKGKNGNNTRNYGDVGNHYVSPNATNPYYGKLDTNKNYNGGNAQHMGPQLGHQGPYYNQIRSGPPNYQVVDNYLDRNQLNGRGINGYQMANQPPMYNQIANQPPMYSQMNGQQLTRSPQLSRAVQQPVKHTYRLNRPRYPGIPSSNSPLTTNLNHHNGNLSNYGQLPRMETTNPFLVK